MGTYAIYRVWAGIKKEELDEAPFFNEVLSSEGLKEAGLQFESIGMHGEVVGIGVIVQELSWETKICDNNLFDLAVVAKAERTLSLVEKVFIKKEAGCVPKLYHHIDLGS